MGCTKTTDFNKFSLGQGEVWDRAGIFSAQSTLVVSKLYQVLIMQEKGKGLE